MDTTSEEEEEERKLKLPRLHRIKHLLSKEKESKFKLQEGELPPPNPSMERDRTGLGESLRESLSSKRESTGVIGERERWGEERERGEREKERERRENVSVNRPSFYDDVVSEVENEYTPLLSNEEGLVFGSLPRKDIETLDYDTVENTLQNEREIEKQSESKSFQSFLRFGFEVLVAIITGTLGVLCTYSSKALNRIKFEAASPYLEPDGDPHLWHAFVIYGSISLFFSVIASITVVLIDPHTRGSGVPEIKAYLNGVKIPNVIGLRALISKVSGVIFSVPAGLIIGKEGPMIHIGAIVGAMVVRMNFLQYFFPVNNLPKPMLDLWTDEKTRDFVSLGGACGVAAAFGAPIGGVLQIEELHSFWSAIITWRSFVATSITTILMFGILTVMRGSPGYLSHDSLIVFGSFEGASKRDDYPIQPGYNFNELMIFILMGVVGGFVGAIFNMFNIILAKWRMKNIVTPLVRIAEVVLISLITTSLVFGISLTSPCVPLPDCPDLDTDECPPPCCEQESLTFKPFQCPDGSYNPMASILYTPLDVGVQHLFHSCQHIPYPTLALFFVVTLFLGCITYGANVPSGVFVPCMLSGAAFGRIIGQLVATGERVADPGSYALIGASALLGGVSRMTISNAVILLEVTDDFTYTIPVIAATLAARFTGGIFNGSLYGTYIDLFNISFISQHKRFLTALRASDVMEVAPVVFREVESVRRLAEVLSTTTYNGFPVIRASKGAFQGLMRRDQVAILLYHRCFQRSPKRQIRSDEISPFFQLPQGMEPHFHLRDSSDQSEQVRRLTWADFKYYYPDAPSIDDIRLYPSDLDLFVDLTPYMNLSAFSVHHSTHATRCHRLFRAMGLRHLTVVNSKNQVVGIITRKHLTKEKSAHRKASYPPAHPAEDEDIINNDEW